MKLLIVGGVAGGASAAARARRMNESAQIILFERTKYVSFANCGLPYHIGNHITNRESLIITSPDEMEKKFNIDVRTNNEVTKIHTDKKQVEVVCHKTATKYIETYDKLILSPGANPFKPDIPGINSERVFTLRTLNDMDVIIKSLKNSRSAVIVGGGYIGLEMMEAISSLNIKLSVIELASQVMGPADPEMASYLHSEILRHKVELRLNNSVESIEESEQQLRLTLNNNDTIVTDTLIMAIGVKPETWLAKDAGLNIGKTGAIEVNEMMQTSDPDIYAIGDCVEVLEYVSNNPIVIPLAGPANRQGRIAADNIMGLKRKYQKTQGSAACKIFDLNFAMTGLSEKLAKKMNIPCDKVFIHAADHASYYPGATSITLKLLFNTENYKVIGAQAIGKNGVDKRIDVIAVAIRAGMTVYDLEDLELAYAPPFNSAKDPVNYAGFAASNLLRGLVEHIHADELDNLDSDSCLLDVRTQYEHNQGKIEGSIIITLDQLRDRIHELDKSKTYIVYCHAGLRGYLACRVLSQKGFKVKNLDGGYKTWLMYRQEAAYYNEYS